VPSGSSSKLIIVSAQADDGDGGDVTLPFVGEPVGSTSGSLVGTALGATAFVGLEKIGDLEGS
jgi:hypothetical protein